MNTDQQFSPTDAQIAEAARYEARRTVGAETCPDCGGTGDAGCCLLCAGWGTISAALAARLAARSGTPDEDGDGSLVVEGQAAS